MARSTREEATVSFHYLAREKRARGKPPKVVPFTLDEFATFAQKLKALPDIDLSNDDTCKWLKSTANSPIEKCESVDDRTVFGRFRSLYSGHAYDNTDVGEVPESSVSLRPFFFVAYLGESGRIYIGSQYLGMFGGYHGLFRTLKLLLPQELPLVSHAFRHNSTSYGGAKPQEVRVNYSRKPMTIEGQHGFGQRGAMTFKRGSSKDEEFNATVSTKLLAKLGQPDAVLKRAVADMISDNEMLAIRDEDIEDCTVVAIVDGKRRVINVIEAGHSATRFSLGVEDFIKGHPSPAKAKSAMLSIMKREIISREERV